RVAGFQPEPVAFFEERADAFRELLLACDGALVWVNPLAEGRDRAVLDPILREAASRGVWVSAHPDVVTKMATKEVLYRTRELGWGSDTRLYANAAEFAAQFPESVARGPRVLKPLRGNDGRGVTKVSGGPETFAVQPASADSAETMRWGDLLERVAAM